jgi:hypothetical protein
VTCNHSYVHITNCSKHILCTLNIIISLIGLIMDSAVNDAREMDRRVCLDRFLYAMQSRCVILNSTSAIPSC